jgi:soluble lytic murein transglycosylase-like protein
MLSGIGYFARLLWRLGWRVNPPRWGVIVVGALASVLLGSAAIYGTQSSAASRSQGLDALEARALLVAGLLEQVEGVYAHDVAPMERVLLGYRSDDRRLVRQIAVSLLREARRTELDPMLLLAVLLVENPWLDPDARSFMGAQGLMQVMPFHRGKWPPCAPRLDDIESNICHGASIFAAYLKQTKGDVDRALLRYNGCVSGTNTPNCHQYANHVYARAGRASVQAWRNVGGPGASP